MLGGEATGTGGSSLLSLEKSIVSHVLEDILAILFVSFASGQNATANSDDV
jgi:hypothetical protein